MEQQETFTPGPWTQGTVGEGPHAANVVWLGETDKRIEVANRDNDEANARLIAAAPDMYKLLQQLSEGNAYDVTSLAIEAGAMLAKINAEKLPVYPSVDAYAGHMLGRGEA